MNSLCSHERLELALAGLLNADDESTSASPPGRMRVVCWRKWSGLREANERAKKLRRCSFPMTSTMPCRCARNAPQPDFVVEHLGTVR